VRGKKAEGLRFEAKVIDLLVGHYDCFIASLPFRYYTELGERFCIPDGVFVFENEVVVVEIKLQHTLQAWFQITKLYFPVLEKAFNLPVRGVEVVRWFNKEIRFPSELLVVPDLRTFLQAKNKLGVCLWRI
jgi:hypothetical protein